MSFLLDTHTHAGGVWGFFEEVFLHGLLDTLKLIPFLFLTYLLMEFIEHRAEDKTRAFVTRAGRLAPLAGGLFGAVPQCGFSAAAANLYTGRVIGLGALIAIFLSTSDEMLPILISGEIQLYKVLLILLYKVIVGILVGFTIDFILRLIKRPSREINIDEICDNDNCHCERGILPSAIHHTVTIFFFVYLFTVAINAAVYFIGDEALASVFYN
ncbi:MAG: arsenic efflux protein, partial [Clostridia bacterium]|nr:arsenic efflux protein [Clostridia bacterium]